MTDSIAEQGTRMAYSQKIETAFEAAIGKDGADPKRFDALLEETGKAVETLRARRDDTSLPVLSIGELTCDLDAIEAAAARIRGFKRFIVLGMGGSSYGGKALCALAQHEFAHGHTSVHFIDNIDPLSTGKTLLSLDFSSCFFAVVSKSGDTAETLAQALIFIEEITSRLGAQAVAERFIAITEPKDSALTRLAKAHRMQVLDHDPNIGGRFSVLTCVGLLPACVMGLDIRALRKGARAVVQSVFDRPGSEPARGAALHRALEERGRTLAVLMPYCDRLDAFNTWYRQLWAESLGKGGKGTTPLRSLGACDQHSQLQLYLDGPRDKFISLILLEQAGKGPALPEIADASLGYMRGRTLGDLMDTEQRATAETLTRNRCPVRILALERLDEEAMGALLMHFMLETMIVGELMGVNSFDQPAVEEGKILARKYMTQG